MYARKEAVRGGEQEQSHWDSRPWVDLNRAV